MLRDRRPLMHALVAALLLAVAAGDAQAQTREDGSTHVVIALAPSLERADARAVILREPAATPQNYIVVTEATTAADLAKAIALLQRARRSTGDALDRGMRAFITAADPARGRASANVRRADAWLRRVRDADAYPVPGRGELPGLVARLAPVQVKATPGAMIRRS